MRMYSPCGPAKLLLTASYISSKVRRCSRSTRWAMAAKESAMVAMPVPSMHML